jgi:hypothetical protein
MYVLEEVDIMKGSGHQFRERRTSEPVDFEAIERLVGERPREVDGGEGALLIAEHYVRVDRDVRSPIIERRLRARMKEHCESVAEHAFLDAQHTVFYCPERRKFFAYRVAD